MLSRKMKYPVDRNEIVKSLSEKRLSSYLIFPPYTDERDAIFAYSYMQHLSVCLFLPLHYLEITLRNRIYDVLVRHYKWRGKKYKFLGNPEDWLEWMPANKITKKKVSLIKSGLNASVFTPNDLVSNLSLMLLSHLKYLPIL